MVAGSQDPLTDAQIAADARDAGFWGENLVTIVATALAESGGDPDVPGDVELQTAVWGPSMGLTQIRSLWADYGTGRPRDLTRLDESQFNLRSAFTISRGGTDFTPWTEYVNQGYRKFLARARAAVAGLGTGGRTGLSPGAFGSVAGAGAGFPGSGIVSKLVEPITSGLARIALTGLLVAGGVGLVLAGGYRAVTSGGR